MFRLDAWDIVLLVIAAFVAITTLVRLMQVFRDNLLKSLRREFEAEQQRLQAEEKQREREKAGERAA